MADARPDNRVFFPVLLNKFLQNVAYYHTIKTTRTGLGININAKLVLSDLFQAMFVNA